MDKRLLRITDLKYRERDDDVLVITTGRDENGDRVACHITGTRPYAFVPDHENIELDVGGRVDLQGELPEEDWIEKVESGYQGYDGIPLRKVTTTLPKHVNDLKDHFDVVYEADIPYVRRVSIDYGLSGYVRVPEDKVSEVGDSEVRAENAPKVSVESVDTGIDSGDVEEQIEPRVLMADIEAIPPGEGGSFDRFVEEANKAITAITTYDTYAEEYCAFVLDPENVVEGYRVKQHLREHWDDDGGLNTSDEYQKYVEEADIRLIKSTTEKDLLLSFIDTVEEYRPDLLSGWNWIDFDHQYILNRLRNHFDNINEHRLSDVGTVNGFKVAEKIDGLPGFDMMDAFCFSGDTDVLTPDGVRNIKELEEGDTVYTLNEDTHEVEEKPVVETHETENKWGALESHSGRSHDFKVTPNHRFYVSEDTRTPRGELTPDDYSYREYRDLSEEQRPYKFPEHASGGGERRETFDLASETECPVAVYSDDHGMNLRSRLDATANGCVEIAHGTDERVAPEGGKVRKYLMSFAVYGNNKDVVDEFADTVALKADRRTKSVPMEYDMNRWLSLMGWYISEGHVRSDSNAVCITQHSLEHRPVIRQLLEDMGLPYNEKPKCFEIPGRVLGRWFKKHCGEGSLEKRIPEWVFDLHPDHLEHLLDSLVDGDGTRKSDTSVSYATVSDELKDDVARLGLLCGWKPNISEHDDLTHVHEVYLSRQGGSFKKADGDSIDYDGTVYCITAKDNHAIMAGRNGTFSWIGQCEKMTFSQWRSKSLDFVAGEELDTGKVEDVSVGEDYQSDRNRFLAYNIIDTQLLVGLDEKHGIHEFFYELADLSHIQIYDTFSEMRLVDGFLMAHRNDNEILPTQSEKDLDMIPGGLVLSPSDGVEEWVAVFDLKSLYPSVFITLNVSEETLTKNPEYADLVCPDMPENEANVGGEITEENIGWDVEQGAIGSQTENEGVLPKYLALLFEERAEKKEIRNQYDPEDPRYQVWDNKQNAVKVIMNSFYGVSQNKYYRLSTPIQGSQGIGSTITAGGRYTLWRGAQIAESMGYEVKYGDTDSIMISLADSSENVTPREVVERGEEVEEAINDAMDDVADEFGIPEEHPFLKDKDLHGNDRHCLHWEFEKLYRRFLQSGSKKRYAGLKAWSEGKWLVDPDATDPDYPDPDITGFEANRADVPPITADTQETTIKKVLSGADFEEVSEYVQSVVQSVKNHERELSSLGTPGVINKPLEEYPNRPTKRACLYSNEHLGYGFREGDDPWIYKVSETPPMKPNTDVIALEWGDDELPEGYGLDVNGIIDKKLRQPLEPVIPWSFTELQSGRQMQGIELGDNEESDSNPFSSEDEDTDTDTEDDPDEESEPEETEEESDNNETSDPLSW